MAANDHPDPIFPNEHRWTIATGSSIECPVCESEGLSGLTVDDHGGEMNLAFKCEHGHSWTVRLALEDGRIVPHLCDPRRRDGAKALIPWSRSLSGGQRRIFGGDEPGALNIHHVDSDEF